MKMETGNIPGDRLVGGKGDMPWAIRSALVPRVSLAEGVDPIATGLEVTAKEETARTSRVDS